MRGIPKNLNSKFDYEYIKEHYSKKDWQDAWQSLLDNRYQWFITAKLEKKENGIEDEVHRVKEITDMDNNVEYYQEEYMTDVNSHFVKFGFTKEEVEAALAEKE